MQNKTPVVSVIVPAYNEEKYIVQTLEALQQQDYPAYEVLVVNNASADRTADLVALFISRQGPAGRFHLLHEPRQGTQYARECGRKAAMGNIIAQLDADCLPPADWISKGVALLQAKNVVAVAGPYNYFDSDIFVRTLTYLSQLFILQSLNSLVQLLRRGGVIIGGNVFIRAAVLEQCGGYNTALTFYGDDVDIARKVSRFGHIRFTQKIMVRSSSRRYRAAGFFRVQSKYTQVFLQTVFAKGLARHESMELVHPR